MFLKSIPIPQRMVSHHSIVPRTDLTSQDTPKPNHVDFGSTMKSDSWISFRSKSSSWRASIVASIDSLRFHWSSILLSVRSQIAWGKSFILIHLSILASMLLLSGSENVEVECPNDDSTRTSDEIVRFLPLGTTSENCNFLQQIWRQNLLEKTAEIRFCLYSRAKGFKLNLCWSWIWMQRLVGRVPLLQRSSQRIVSIHCDAKLISNCSRRMYADLTIREPKLPVPVKVKRGRRPKTVANTYSHHRCILMIKILARHRWRLRNHWTCRSHLRLSSHRESASRDPRVSRTCHHRNSSGRFGCVSLSRECEDIHSRHRSKVS